jgi:branched-chain amino acid transport system ATP-binding protein
MHRRHPADIQAREGLTVLLAEQNATWPLLLASCVVTFCRGRVKMTGNAAALLDDSEVRRAYLGV